MTARAARQIRLGILLARNPGLIPPTSAVHLSPLETAAYVRETSAIMRTSTRLAA